MCFTAKGVGYKTEKDKGGYGRRRKSGETQRTIGWGLLAHFKSAWVQRGRYSHLRGEEVEEDSNHKDLSTEYVDRDKGKKAGQKGRGRAKSG